MKSMVIMGASSGIGLAAARALASRGVRLGLAARRLGPLRELREQYPDCVEIAEIDVNSPDAPGRLRELIERLGGMEIYFHVSGIGYDNPDFTPEREAAILETNSVGFARMLSAAYGWFAERGRGGRIAAVTSVGGTRGVGEFSAYSSSKKCAQAYLTALRQLSHGRRDGISITDIRPGWIETPLLHDSTVYPMQMSLDYALPRILRAVLSRRPVVYVDWRWGLLVSAWRLIPDCLWTRMHLPLTFKKN